LSNIEIFRHEQFGEVRAVDINGTGWLVGKDVAEKLGYVNTRDALSKHVDEDDKADVAIRDGSQNRNMTVINESGLYSLVLSSKLPGAKAFKKWVTSDVLPSIRRSKYKGRFCRRKLKRISLKYYLLIAFQLRIQQYLLETWLR
jgi:prophage antirepressor-like protein